jgi:hypothetical protein
MMGRRVGRGGEAGASEALPLPPPWRRCGGLCHGAKGWAGSPEGAVPRTMAWGRRACVGRAGLHGRSAQERRGAKRAMPHVAVGPSRTVRALSFPTYTRKHVLAFPMQRWPFSSRHSCCSPSCGGSCRHSPRREPRGAARGPCRPGLVAPASFALEAPPTARDRAPLALRCLRRSARPPAARGPLPASRPRPNFRCRRLIPRRPLPPPRRAA